MSVYLQDIDDWIPRVDSALFYVSEDVLQSHVVLEELSDFYKNHVHDDVLGDWPSGSLPADYEGVPFDSQANSAFNMMIEEERRPLLAYAAVVHGNWRIQFSVQIRCSTFIM